MSEDFIREKFNDHEKRIEKLEDVTSTLQTMDYRLGSVENTVSDTKKDVSSINEKIDMVLKEPAIEKSKKWDKLIDYLFYFVLAIILGYIAMNLNIK